MRCPSCHGPLSATESRCPRCGADPRVSALSTEALPQGAPPGAPARPGRDLAAFPPGMRFAGRYTIVERAGAGGMGIVYKAIDTALDQVVALKLIQPALSGIPSFIERFKSEVRLTRQISHPNVCRVHDLGTLEDVPYLSMAWVQGETLRQLLRRAGRIEPGRALLIASKMAAALGAAHDRGIAHRDLKPENVMLDERGEVYVMDFGLAGASAGASSAESRGPIGTPPYLAPEQIAGGAADARSDLFVLGLVLREMLSGRRPRPGAARARKPGPEIPRPARPILARLLAPDPARRFASGAEAAAALDAARRSLGRTDPAAAPRRRRRRLALGALAAVVLAGLLVTAWRALRAGRIRRTPVATAPSAGPPSPARPFYDRGVAYIESEDDSVRSIDSAIQMLRRAVEADAAFAPAWARLGEASWVRFERTGVEEARSDAREAVDEALRLAPALPEALYARGVGEMVESDFQAAAGDLEHALSHRSDFGPAWASLGSARTELGDYAGARQALQRAIDLEPGRSKPWTRLGVLYDRFQEYEAALAAYRKAVALRPDDRMAWNNICATQLRAGRPADAEAACSRSLQIEPRATTLSNLGTARFYQHDYAGAADAYRRAANLDPKDPLHWANLGDALGVLGRKDEAREAYGRAVPPARALVKQRPGDTEALRNLALACAKAGDASCALESARQACALQPENADLAFTRAIVLSLLEQRDAALEWLDRAVRLGLGRAQIENEPALAPLRDDPRYQKILARAS